MPVAAHPEHLRVALLSYRGNMRCGGQGVYLWHLARGLARLGHRVEVWCGPPYPDPMPFVEAVHRLPGNEFFGKWFNPDRRGFLPEPRPLSVLKPLPFYELGASWLGFLVEPALFSLRAFAAVTARAQRTGAFDVVHDVQSLGYGLLGLRARGTPVVSTVHHPLTVDRAASFRADRTFRDAVGTAKFFPIGMQAFVARRIDGILTSSRSSAARIHRDFRVPRERITDVANGVDTDCFRPRPLAREPSTVLCVARAADPNKGVRDLVRALRHLPDDIALELVDDAGPSNPARVWAKRAGVAHRLTITGALPIDVLAERYARATLVAVPSHHEGFGLPAVEAMASETPVVAAAGGALAEVLADGGGTLVPVGQTEAMAGAIRELIARPSLRATLGQKGREIAVRRYSWASITDATCDVYRAVRGAGVAGDFGLPTRISTSAAPGKTPANRSATSSHARA